MTGGPDTDPYSVLAGLHLDYPAFRFSREFFGRHGRCWVAQRWDRAADGVHTVITQDLGELRDALAGESSSPEPLKLTKDMALLAML